MTFRSKLFATVAFPVLSASLIATPALADALMKPFEVAQDSGEQAQPSEEELLQQRQAEEQRAAEEEAQRQAEEQQRAAEEEAQRAAEEQQKAAEQEAQRQAEEQQKAADEEAQRQAEEQQRAAEEEAQRAAEEQQKAAEEEAQRAAAEQQKAADEEAQRQAEEQQKAADEEAQRAAAEQQKAADEEAQRAAEEQQKAADEEAQRAAAEQQKAADEEAQRQAEEQQKAAEEQQQQTEQQQPAEEQPVEQQPAIVTDEQQQQPADGSTAEQPADGGTEQPATAETGETPAGEPVPEVVDTLSPEEKQAIAEDPGKTDETVVLPVENGAAVLDSDKDADNTGGRMSREERRKQREELRAQEEVPLPASDDSAQAEIPQEVREAVPQKIEAAIKEEGQRVDAAPVFAVPETTNIVNNTVINNTVINNNTVNNTVNNNTVNNNVTQVNVVETIDNRTVLSVGNQLIVRGDDRPRLRRDSEEVYYDELARGRTRETIVRPGGVQIITIYNRYGDVIQRSRIGRDGREYILVYAPELEEDAPRPDLVDVGYELPPMRLRIPLRDYIVDTSSDPDRDYYEFLSEPPVERVERVYTINEVKQSARLRDKVRRIDLDTVTFATGSAEVPMSQARTLRKVAEAMSKILDKDPGETFLIEGHTDAVGSDKSNLVLSDRRADSVASLLTEVYGIPPENLQTQGYGERFLKVRTQSAEQQNRRVTIRRVTTLVRPVASAN
ncbi:OmpA family protein [Shinella oryzae]|uniref:OmpA family protein n=1 Tax=Shinella oryzae TaxID=2871820 RepID=A0ABY9K1R8_9HYPH|nr:OmpA family protein [Shinella oryzae]WLS02502.1 OmpA family protein [Shinella oryzae]